MHLYKYLSPARLDVLSGLVIRLTQPSDFNDPFEVVPNVANILAPDAESYLDEFAPAAKESFEAELERQLTSSGLPSELKNLMTYDDLGHDVVKLMGRMLPSIADSMRPTFGRRMQARFGRKFGILSLSAVATNLLMWAHYADSHKGFVVEFDSAHPFFDQRANASDVMCYAHPVVYSDDRPAITLFDPSEEDICHAERLVAATLLTKGRDWRYECEWRLILPLDDLEQYPHHVTGDMHLFPLPPSVITAVIVGARSGEQLDANIRKLIATNKELSHVAIRHARTSDTRYEVTVEDIGTTPPEAPAMPRAFNLRRYD